ncbi:MAG: class I SAM-dependent methyltransferase [Sphingopyxis sp.]|nr:class I SAM-dependent methyltransferase [Sphingopyxis sp.]
MLAKAPAAWFHRQLDRVDAGLDQGALEAHLPDGTVRILGGRGDGPMAVVHLARWTALVRLALSGSVGWYVAWDLGEWSSPDPVPLFDLFMRNAATLGGAARAKGPWRALNMLRHALRRNDRAGSRRNILAHYDLGNDFYARWLDETMTYSSARFVTPDMSLADAQIAKIDLALDRLRLHSGSRLLEVGCGWGSLSARAIERHDAVVQAITLSPEQARVAAGRLAALDPGGKSRVSITDYRDVTGQYDAIASIEMVEAVGRHYWPAYLDTLARLLRPDGRAAIQFIAIRDDLFEAYAAGRDFIQTFIFPGGCLLGESEFRGLAEARGFVWEKAEHFGEDYAETLRQWRERFDAVAAAGQLPPGFDERFVRLWRYYLQYCEGGFRGGGITVAQVTLVKE